jgi:hypothetical protein
MQKTEHCLLCVERKIELVALQRELRRVAAELQETQNALAAVKATRFPIAAPPSDDFLVQRLDHIDVRMQDTQKTLREEISRLRRELELEIAAEQRTRRSELDRCMHAFSDALATAKRKSEPADWDAKIETKTRNLDNLFSDFSVRVSDKLEAGLLAAKNTAEISASSVAHALRRIGEAELDAAEARRRSEISHANVQEEVAALREELKRDVKDLEISCRENIHEISRLQDEKREILDARVSEIEAALRLGMENLAASVQHDVRSLRDAILRIKNV